MNNKKAELCVELTIEALRRYWQLDYEYVISLCTEDVFWIGSLRDQFMKGIDQFRADLSNSVKELKPCSLYHKEFQVIHRSATACTVAGRYLVETDSGSDVMLSAWQRCVTLWVEQKGVLRIQYMYVSNALDEVKVKTGERFPNALGKKVWERMKGELEQHQKEQMCSVKEKGRSVHMFSVKDLLCVEASKHDLVLHFADERIVTRMSMTRFMEMVKDRCPLLRVHKGYAVNPRHVAEVLGDGIMLQNGMRIPVSPKRIADVRRNLAVL